MRDAELGDVRLRRAVRRKNYGARRRARLLLGELFPRSDDKDEYSLADHAVDLESRLGALDEETHDDSMWELD